ncbi:MULTISPECIES: C40 family peptidase [unclassified Glutamicibacter]|uniref:C40 family peptidase n=1 Tax=unclassified Glutamicibacter TaxID=2627139 RepID=UPI00093F6077|nr:MULTISPECIES: C40 family peptidase [unclassified Glutamicibacter]QEP06275.1 cell wall lytic activity [Glutamicibacter sp. ZJUTW]
MTKSHARGRRRADVPRTNSLQAISQAVASNAGSVGRQAAVVAAASGLIVTLGVPGQATAPRDVSAAPVDTINPERVAVKAVKVAADKKADVEIERASFTAEEKPEPVVIAVSNDITPTTRNSNSGSSDSMAPMTRQSRSGGQESAPQQQQQAQPKTETKVQTSNLSGIAATAAKYVGVPYVWGGNGPSGWDCSGFVKYVYAQHGINIARGTSAILGSGQFVRTSNPKPGDLVFQNGGGHVGIYLGGGQMIGAQNPTVDTMIHSVSRNPLYGYYTLAG